MRTTLSVLAAIVGTVSATPHLYGYGASYNVVPSGSAPIKGHSTEVVPSSKPAYIKPSDSVYVPIPSGHSYSSLPGTHGSYTKPSGTGYVPSSSSIYTVPSGTSIPPTGTGPHIKPSGTGHISSSTHTSASGTGTKSIPTATGTVPAGTGSATSGKQGGTTSSTDHVYTHTTTGNVPSTTTVTHYGTTTYVETITTFVPCSTPIATSVSSTYYSSFLTVSYSTKTITSTITNIEVICPATTPSYNKPTGGPGKGANIVTEAGYTGGSGSGPSTVTVVPIVPSYAPHTVYNSGPAPTAGTCGPEKTIYSTVVVEITKTVESSPTHAAAAAYHCPVCETYTFTLPNGSPITTIISPSPSTHAASTQTVTPSKPHGDLPPFPNGHNGTIPYPTGTGVHISHTKGNVKPSASGGYRY